LSSNDANISFPLEQWPASRVQFTSEIDHFRAPYLLLHRSNEFVIENGDFSK
jgi:hypothetical protein